MELKYAWADHTKVPTNLLIVPYGIEIGYGGECQHQLELLIVPYGIEIICELVVGGGRRPAFNRTIWN